MFSLDRMGMVFERWCLDEVRGAPHYWYRANHALHLAEAAWQPALTDYGGSLMSRGAVEEHYASTGITARILTALRAVNGPDVPITPDTLAPIDHFHRRGVLKTEELAALLQPKASDHLLDIGCGIGGPARWIAAKYGCRVTGVDLTAEFCEAARELNRLTGLADRVQILHGSALSLPLPDNSVDRAYSQAALMNISNKLGVFS
jgi:SAM-dependent methyltransferase